MPSVSFEQRDGQAHTDGRTGHYRREGDHDAGDRQSGVVELHANDVNEKHEEEGVTDGHPHAPHHQGCNQQAQVPRRQRKHCKKRYEL